MMRILVVAMLMLNASLIFANSFESVKELKSIESISEAIVKHYNSLSLNEQWGVGMSCTQGAMTKLVKAASMIKIDRTQGLILADLGTIMPQDEDSVLRQMKIEYTPGTEEITKVSITTTYYNGETHTCSTRDPLIEF